MANRLGARKNSKFKAVSTAPSFNKTPVGNSTPPLPYPVTQDLSNSVGTVASVRFNGDPAYVLDQTTQPSCQGDAAGSCKGVKSGTVGGEVKPVKASSTVRVGGKPIIRDGDPCTMNGGNSPGVFITTQAPSGSLQGGASTADTNPPVTPDTPEEQHFWSKASPWVHGVLGVASFVPGLSIVTGAADAAIYAAEGNAIEAGLAAASMIPGGKIATTAGKAVKSARKMGKGTQVASEGAQAVKAVDAAGDAGKVANATAHSATPAQKTAAPTGGAGGGNGMKVAGKGKRKPSRRCELVPHEELQCGTGQEAHHVVPDWMLRLGKRGGPERVPGTPSLKNGPAICLEGGSGKEHNTAHKHTDRPAQRIARSGKSTGVPGTLKLGQAKVISARAIEKATGGPARGGCTREDIQQQLDEYFKAPYDTPLRGVRDARKVTNEIRNATTRSTRDM